MYMYDDLKKKKSRSAIFEGREECSNGSTARKPCRILFYSTAIWLCSDILSIKACSLPISSRHLKYSLSINKQHTKQRFYHYLKWTCFLAALFMADNVGVMLLCNVLLNQGKALCRQKNCKACSDVQQTGYLTSSGVSSLPLQLTSNL